MQIPAKKTSLIIFCICSAMFCRTSFSYSHSVVGRIQARVSRDTTNIFRSLSSSLLLSKQRINSVMEHIPSIDQASSYTNDALTNTYLKKAKTSGLKMEFAFRGMKTASDRSLLLKRFAKIKNKTERSSDDQNSSRLSGKLDSSTLYVLRTKGHTTKNGEGVGIGMALYDPETNKELWKGRIFMKGDRTLFEGEYTAVITGMEYMISLGARRLIIQTNSDILVRQIDGIFNAKKSSVKTLLEKVRILESKFDQFHVEEIKTSENIVCKELAQDALAEQQSLNIQTIGNFKVIDPMSSLDQQASYDESVDNYNPQPISSPIDSYATYLLRFDGGSRGNPGTAGAGYVLYDESGTEVWAGWKFHHEPATNNVAEYLGLVCGLKGALSSGVKRLIVEGDSQLIVRQLMGEYECRSESLKTFFSAAKQQAQKLEYFEIRHIPRAENARADWLANQAMDLKESGGFDADNAQI